MSAASGSSVLRVCWTSPACHRSATTTRTCSGCRAAAAWSPGPTRPTAGRSTRPAIRRCSTGTRSRSSTSRASGVRAVLVPEGPDGSHEVFQLGGSDKPGGDDLATQTAIQFDEGVGELGAGPLAAGRALAPEHRAAPGSHDGHRRRRRRRQGGRRRRQPVRPASTPRPIPSRRTSSCGIRSRGAGASARRSRSGGPITRPRFCCRTAVSSRPATTTTTATPTAGSSPRTAPRSTSRRTCSTATTSPRGRESPRRRARSCGTSRTPSASRPPPVAR